VLLPVLDSSGSACCAGDPDSDPDPDLDDFDGPCVEFAQGRRGTFTGSPRPAG
jgi:hypothetical protein